MDVQSVHFGSKCSKYEMSRWTFRLVDVPFGGRSVRVKMFGGRSVGGRSVKAPRSTRLNNAVSFVHFTADVYMNRGLYMFSYSNSRQEHT